MTTLEAQDEIKVVELDWFADNDSVRVTPRNQQRFDIQKDKAIEILQRDKERDLFVQQFQLLLHRLGEWIRARKDKIAKAILTLQDNALAFVVVRNDAKYDEQFQDDLADVDIEIANDSELDLIELKTLALPNVSADALRSFLDERLTLSYNDGERSGSH
jgi:hypothetical protein